MRLMAMHTWPLLTKAEKNSFGATARGSTSSSTMAASLPPNSSVRRLRLPAQLAMTFLPVATDPVKEILSMPGCAVIHSPRSSPPASTFSTPGGNTSRSSSAIFSVHSGVYGEGLSTTVLPV